MVMRVFALRSTWGFLPKISSAGISDIQHLCKHSLALLFCAQFSGQPKSWTLTFSLSQKKPKHCWFCCPCFQVFGQSIRKVVPSYTAAGTGGSPAQSAVSKSRDALSQWHRFRRAQSLYAGALCWKYIRRYFSVSLLLANSHTLIREGNSPWEIIWIAEQSKNQTALSVHLWYIRT